LTASPPLWQKPHTTAAMLDHSAAATADGICMYKWLFDRLDGRIATCTYKSRRNKNRSELPMMKGNRPDVLVQIPSLGLLRQFYCDGVAYSDYGLGQF